MAVTAAVPLPSNTPPSVRVVAPLPPLPTGSVPVTPDVSVTCAQAGMLLVPVLVSTLVEEVDLAKRLGVLAAEQYRISPRVVRMAGAVKSIFDFTWALSKAAVTTSPVTQVRGVVKANVVPPNKLVGYCFQGLIPQR